MNFENFNQISDFTGLTRTSQSQKIAESLKANVKLISKVAFIYNDKNKLWEELNYDKYTTYIFNFFNETINNIEKVVGKTDSKKISKLINSFDNRSYIKDIMERMAGTLTDVNFTGKLNKQIEFLPIKDNKKINLRTLEILERKAEDYFTFSSDVEFVDKTPNADKFFKQLMPNKENREYLRKCLGYLLTGSTEAQAFFIMYGSGGNGKSTLSSLLQKILGKFYVQCHDDIFNNKASSSGSASPYFAELLGKRCGVYSEGETADKMDINIKTLKQISGEDLVKARDLYKGPIEFHADVKLCLLSNFIPPLTAEKAVKDRVRYIFLDQDFRKSNNVDVEFIDNLKTKYLNEVFSWMAKGAKDYYENEKEKLKMSEEFRKRTDKLLMGEDSISTFLERKVERTEHKSDYLRRKDLFETYKKYCDENSQRCQPRSTLFNRLEHLKYELFKKDGYDVYRFIKIRENEEDDNEDDKPVSVPNTKEEMKLIKQIVIKDKGYKQKFKDALKEIEQLKQQMNQMNQKPSKKIMKQLLTTDEEIIEEDDFFEW